MARLNLLRACATLAALAVPAAAFAAPPADPPAMSAPGPDTSALPPDVTAKVDKHISDLHNQLGITTAEEPQWNSFAQIMRDNVAAMHKAIEDRGTGMGKMNAVDNMKSYAELARVNADNMQKLAAGVETLYASLSDDQKQTADSVFRNEQKRHDRMMRKHTG